MSRGDKAFERAYLIGSAAVAASMLGMAAMAPKPVEGSLTDAVKKSSTPSAHQQVPDQNRNLSFHQFKKGGRS